MADLLIELYSEEIPAGMQAGAAEQLARKIAEFLKSFEVTADSVATYVAPQRVALLASGLPQNLPDRKEQKKGPRIDAPEKAIEGFLRANGLDNADALSVQEDKKGAFYILDIDEPGGPLADALASFMPGLIEGFQWPKSMRWGSGSLRWVRPLRSVLCLFDGAIVPFEIGGLKSGNVTYGHRFMAPDEIAINDPHDYVGALERAFVLADAPVREAMIAESAAALAASVDCDLVEDAGLIRETAGLVEWPVALLGKIDDAFMDVPEEVLVSVMRTHQKYFALRQKDGKLAPYFITISNMLTDDKGAAIIAGNERVLRARLSDGRFFWDQDRKHSLESRLPQLEKITFQAKLGTVRQKAEHMYTLVGQEGFEGGLASYMIADVEAAKRAAKLCKVDLVSGMVYEFPELQGIMGGYYAQNDQLGDDVAAAIRDHYKPLGPGDAIPATAEGQAVALADKIDTLAGFWSIDEKPTGSKDPFALRRAALGIIRIFIETEKRLALFQPLRSAIFLRTGNYDNEMANDLLGFIVDRLKVYLREKEGLPHDVVAAASTVAGRENTSAEYIDDLVTLSLRARAVDGFLKSEDGSNLLTVFRRANGILKKAGHDVVSVDEDKLSDADKLFLEYLSGQNSYSLENLADLESYTCYLQWLATLRAPVDGFFGAVMVNDDDAKIRHNRLSLLRRLVNLMRRVADFDLIE